MINTTDITGKDNRFTCGNSNTLSPISVSKHNVMHYQYVIITTLLASDCMLTQSSNVTMLALLIGKILLSAKYRQNTAEYKYTKSQE